MTHWCSSCLHVATTCVPTSTVKSSCFQNKRSGGNRITLRTALQFSGSVWSWLTSISCKHCLGGNALSGTEVILFHRSAPKYLSPYLKLKSVRSTRLPVLL